MINFLAKTFLHANKPSFYDGDSASLLQLVSKLHGTMNEVIGEFNKLEKSLTESFEEFKETSSKDAEVFRVSIRQEFQDFIDIIELKVKGINDAIESHNKTVENRLSAQDKKLEDLESSIVETATSVINQHIENGSLYVGVVEQIDPADESKVTIDIVASPGTSSSETITFTIDGPEFTAEKDMTWAEWCDSEYNTIEAYVNEESEFVMYVDGEEEWQLRDSSDGDVLGSHKIIADEYYTGVIV